MITTILSDLAYVLLFPKDSSYHDELNALYARVGNKSDFVFGNYFIINQALFDFYNSLRNKYELYMYTSGTLQNADDIKDRVRETFRVVFSAAELEISKKDYTSYQLIATKLSKNPNEILFIDDTKANIEAAKQAGFQTHLFTTNESLFNLLK